METREAIEMMQRCRSEIQELQKRIEYLAPRAEAYELLRDIVRMQARSDGMPRSEDIVHILTRAINNHTDQMKRAEMKQQAEPPDRSKEYRGVVVSAQEGAQTIGSTVSGVEQYRAAREAEQATKRNVGKRPGYDGVKD